jgi:hypothetical protein
MRIEHVALWASDLERLQVFDSTKRPRRRLSRETGNG